MVSSSAKRGSQLHSCTKKFVDVGVNFENAGTEEPKTTSYTAPTIGIKGELTYTEQEERTINQFKMVIFIHLILVFQHFDDTYLYNC
jgi:hypothetical protein